MDSSTGKRVVIMGAGGRDFHDFAQVFRDDPDVEVVAFTATQIPGIDDRTYPASLAGPRYPDGIPIVPENDLASLIARRDIDEVVFSYSDTSHETVMHAASRALASGAAFRLLSPRQTMLQASKPVVAVCAVRTGCGKSQTARHVGALLTDAGLTVALIRHPMPYGDLERMRVQRFATLADIDAADPTIEEREEYEEPVRQGMVMFAGVDYTEILAQACTEADVIVWDGGNNDMPFVAPDLLITVTDPLRAGHGLTYHPGEVNLRMADVVVINKVDSATPEQLLEVERTIAGANPKAVLVRAASPVTLGDGPQVSGRRVLVVEDGPTITHGGMAFGAGTVAARAAGAGQLVDPRPHAVGSLVETFARFPHIGPVLPAMGYSADQVRDLSATMDAVDCDVVVTGTPMDLSRIAPTRHPVRHATYELEVRGTPTIGDVLRERIITPA